MLDTAPAVGIGLLFVTLTVVVARGPITVPDGVAFARLRLKVFVAACSALGSAVRWTCCVLWPGAKASVPAAAV